MGSQLPRSGVKRSGPARLCGQWARQVLVLQGRADALPGARGGHVRPGGCGRAGDGLGAEPGALIALGVNLDDLSDHRPGQLAAKEGGAYSPWSTPASPKRMSEEMSRSLGLRTWDKPAAACLASRLPYGTPVSLGVLGAVERAEAGLAGLGFRASRVRHYGELARIELPLPEIERAVACRQQLVRRCPGSWLPLRHPRHGGPPLRQLERGFSANEPVGADQEMAI